MAGLAARLPVTGERTVPGIRHEQYWFARHEVVYRWIAGLTRDGTPVARGRVLDAGCGEGYGAALLSRSGAGATVALDYDHASVRNVRDRYAGVHCVRGNLVRLGLTDGCFDLVVSLQTIEHLWDQPGFVAECRRVLRPGGTLVLSTPNRLTFPPGNPFHARELSAAELLDLVGDGFAAVEVAGTRHGPRLREWEARHGSLVDAQLAGAPPSWSAEVAEVVAAVTHRDFEIGGTPVPDVAALDDCLDVLVTARRP